MSVKDLKKRESTVPVKAGPQELLPTLMPTCDIVETPTEFRLTADLPGCDETSVNLELEGHVLTVRGTFQPTTPQGYSLTYQEYRSGNYERSFTLGDSIDRSSIQAGVKDGVLSLTLPKAKEAQPRRIPIKAA